MPNILTITWVNNTSIIDRNLQVRSTQNNNFIPNNTTGIYIIYANGGGVNIGDIQYVGHAVKGQKQQVNGIRGRFQGRMRALRELGADPAHFQHVRIKYGTLTRGNINHAERLCIRHVINNQNPQRIVNQTLISRKFTLGDGVNDTATMAGTLPNGFASGAFVYNNY